ncbi:MAG: hypothetical protein LW870_23570, partial [Pirellula sp.]|nr:hypothetical protein [Pirellula sp.]
QERVGFWGRTHRFGLASAIVADATWGHCWPTDAMGARGDALGDLLQISRQFATCCATRMLVGVVKFRIDFRRRSLGSMKRF